MKNRKNIVWILTDSQHAEAVGYMGIIAVHTPNLDKLAAKSQIFTSQTRHPASGTPFPWQRRVQPVITFSLSNRSKN